MSIPLIADKAGVQSMVDELRKEAVIGVDTEFIRETTFFPKIALIQVATREQSWLIDPLALDSDSIEPLLEVLFDRSILKVMHAAFADQECLYWSYGRVAEPIFDTAVGGALSGYGDNVGLGKLTKEVLGVHLHKGRARVKWLARPLSNELLHYAQQDVAHLVELTEKLKRGLNEKGRWDWALQESRIDPGDFDTPAEEITQRLAKSGQLDEPTYLVLLELVHWRENRARDADLPRSWVADNEVLVALAKSRPKSLAELRSFRGISPKEVDRNGQAILDAIAEGLRQPKSHAKLPVRSHGPEVDSHALDLIKAYLAYLSARYEIAPRFLLKTGRASDLLLMGKQDPDAWVRKGVLSQHASEIIGQDLKDLLSGKLLIGLQAGRVEIVHR